MALLALGCGRQGKTAAGGEPALDPAEGGNPSAVSRAVDPDPTGGFTPDPELEQDWDPPVDPTRPPTRVEGELLVDDLGNAQFSRLIKLPPGSQQNFRRLASRPYLEDGVLRWREPRTQSVVRILDLESADAVLEGIQGQFDEDGIRVQGREIGWAKQRDGQWVYNLAYNRQAEFRITRKVYRGDAPTVRITGFSNVAGFQILLRLKLNLPARARDIRIENTPNQLVYKAPPPRPGAGTGGRASLTVQTKPHIMSALAKLYGDRRFHKLWVARSLFRNNSSETLSDYRVRFRLAGYSEWGRWEKSDVVLPGQTVVDAFYPAIAPDRVMELRGQTPVDVQVEYSYVRPDGKTVSDSTSERTKLLGVNEGVYSDLEQDKDGTWFEMFKDADLVLGSFTSANDPVIQDVVGLLGKEIKGAPVAARDSAAMAFLRALYDLMRVNIAYETTPGNVIDGLLHQHLKYGRDVLRTRSGTCVNTSILFASVVEAAGLDAFIWVVPGHAMAGARLPQSRKLVVVETTGCGGGSLETSMAFEDAVGAAQKTLEKWRPVGLIREVDITQLRKRGVQPPELPNAGRKPLEEWNIRPPSGDRTAAPLPGPGTAPALSGEQHFQQGKQLQQAKRWAEAETAFSRAIEADRRNAAYYNGRALLYMDVGDESRGSGKTEQARAWYSKALDDLLETVKIDPRFTKAWNNAGVICNRTEDNRKAVEFYTRAIECDPRNALAYRNRSKTWLKLGNRTRADADKRMADQLEGK
jgi:Flp pilus assembly protein TadD